LIFIGYFSKEKVYRLYNLEIKVESRKILLSRDVVFDEYPKDEEYKYAIPYNEKEIEDDEDIDVEVKCAYDSNTIGTSLPRKRSLCLRKFIGDLRLS
jgi:hypothetical protein